MAPLVGMQMFLRQKLTTKHQNLLFVSAILELLYLFLKVFSAGSAPSTGTIRLSRQLRIQAYSSDKSSRPGSTACGSSLATSAVSCCS